MTTAKHAAQLCWDDLGFEIEFRDGFRMIPVKIESIDRPQQIVLHAASGDTVTVSPSHYVWVSDPANRRPC